MQSSKSVFFAPDAWVQGAWARNVLLTVGADGAWSAIEPNAALADHAHATVLDAPVLPGLVNAHSHAFQRAIAGLTEHSAAPGSGASDDFWSWRDRMYRVALRITPHQLETIATLLYAELLAGGYTQVCEFHYLHNAVDGRPYANALEISLALVRAAQRVGMGLTLLPTLYMRSGFGSVGVRDDQRRFASTPESVARLVEGVQRQAEPLAGINVGVAVHSLRAADDAAIREVAAFAASGALPLHIHIAEQLQEVQDCIAHTGKRPIEWLLQTQRVDARWNLVHATQATATELHAVRQSDAAVVICPSTEANLGDGVFNYPAYAGLEGHWSIGSDSHVTRRWSEELRLLEYSQRLSRRQRNVASQSGAHTSSAAALFEAALAGGKAATARALGGLAVGCRADFLVLDDSASALLGVPTENLLDALVFSSPDARFKQVFVAGNQVLANDRVGDLPSAPGARRAIAQDFVQTMKALF
jgi:formimidoylglutamate deiminase